MVGLNPLNKLDEIEKEVPGEDDTNIGVAIVVTVVVDVEPVLVKVADVDMVVTGGLDKFACFHL
ncbi:MAG: hypothetical protein ACD_58C00095G0004 [uncultured bacterium]|nr:MAG: hypothetical protein ACD_58C00095G0004 [uncultured bacterium]